MLDTKFNTRIYKYNDGESDVFEDPSKIDYRFRKASEGVDTTTLDNWLDLPRDDDGNLIEDEITESKIALFDEACHQLDPIIRKAFCIKDFDRSTGLGLTEIEVFSILMEYRTWQAEVKKNTETLPTSATPIPDSASKPSEPLKTGSTTRRNTASSSVSAGSIPS